MGKLFGVDRVEGWGALGDPLAHLITWALALGLACYLEGRVSMSWGQEAVDRCWRRLTVPLGLLCGQVTRKDG